MKSKTNTVWHFILSNIIFIALLASLGMLGGAYGFEYIGGLYPCDLCWPQRYAHMAVIIFAAFAFYFKKSNTVKWLRFKMMTTFSYMVSVGYSGYHAGVEQKWWEGPDSCTLNTDATKVSVEEFFKSLENVPLIRCDEIPWEMFGLSMAGYNFLISLVMVFMLCLSLRSDLKNKVS